MENKKKIEIKYALAPAFIGLVLFLALFWRSHESSTFLKRVESAFNATNEEKVLLSNIASGTWDYVCYVGSYTKIADIERALSINPNTLPRMPERNPVYIGGFWFFDGGRLVDRIDFSSLYLQLRGFRFAGPSIDVNGKDVSAMVENAFVGSYCNNRNDAALHLRGIKLGETTYYHMTFSDWAYDSSRER